MAAADDHHPPPHCGRSSGSSNANHHLTTLRPLFDSDPRSSAPRSLRKSSNVWFAPVPSPLLSPAREKGLQIAKKSSRQRSIFSAQPRGKDQIEAEEPTSPKVSCIGQVKSCRKTKAAPLETVSQHSRSGSASPARFFTTPALHTKWASFFGSRKGLLDSREDVPAEDHKPRKWDSVIASNTCSVDGDGYDISASAFPQDDGGNRCHSVLNLPEREHDEIINPIIPDQIPHGAKLKSTYEQLPPLQSVSCKTQNLKVSLEVVPETWLWRGSERLSDNCGAMANKVKCIGRAEPGRLHEAAISTFRTSSHDNSITYPDHCNDCKPVTCSDSNSVIQSSTVVAVDIDSCKRLRDWFNEVDKDSCLHHAQQQGVIGPSAEARSQILAEANEFLQISSDIESEWNDSVHDVSEEKQNLEFEKRNFRLTDFYGGHKPGGKCRKKKRQPAKPFSAVILVGYNLNEDAENKIASCKKLLKGTLEVGRLSFHETGNYLQLLNSEAEFIRSRSATSHRTVIRLQRCNSEPWKHSKCND